ncbi:MAG: PP2C family protein-serine/threonine phosphatase [Anaerolineae bacterium]
MSFFRRLFNSPPEGNTSQDVENSDNQPDAMNDSPEESIPDPIETGDLDLPTTEQLEPLQEDEDSQGPDLDQTLPIAEESDEVTQPRKDLGDKQLDEIPGVTRPLPEAEQFSQNTKAHLIFGQASDQGVVRLSNQDSAFSFFFTSKSVDDFPDFGIFVVADGMGGHQEGEKASAITSRTVAQEILNYIYMPLINGSDMNSADQPAIVEVMVDAVQKANRAVRDQVADGGTTLTAVVIRGEAAHVAHVGDSRAYWINDMKHIERITRDHSVVERLIELGQITRDEAEYHEQRNVLYRAIGQNEDVEVEIHRKRLVANSALLLCSDGLWNLVNDEDILQIVKNTPDPTEACERLVKLANTHGGNDNITAILIKTPTS